MKSSRSEHPIPTWLLLGATLVLFLTWSNSFVAIGYLLGADRVGSRFDWIGLTVARFLPAALFTTIYGLGFHRPASLAVIRVHWRRLLVCSALAVPGYNFALYYGQSHGVPAPIASLTTALLPLYVMIFAFLLLGEAITRRRIAGFLVSVTGMVVIALSRRGDAGSGYTVSVAITALAPLCWSLYSVISKPLAGRVPPLLWTFLAITLGSVMVLPFLPGRTLEDWSRLDGAGWIALLYLSVPCTILGFAVWTWLLRHLEASTLGLTVFLNPPLTTLSKLLLATVAPATFVFATRPQEFVGAGLALLGLGIAVLPGRRWSRGSGPKRSRV